MIAKGTAHNNGVKLAAYMTTGKDGERAELWELRGFASEDIRDAFRSVHVMADGTRCEQPFFHAQVRNPEGETLTRQEWERVADRIEAKLGYSDQPRAIAFHRDEQTGHEHMHIAWSRIDGETLTAKPLPFFKLRLKEVCRELEIELDLTRVKNDRDGPVMAATRDEDEQARRLNVDIRDVRKTIRECWERSDNGHSFAAAVYAEGLALAKGDKRAFVIVDHEGGMHALGQRILGVTVGAVRERLADLDRAQLPTVEQAREQIERARQVERDDLARQDALAAAAAEKEKAERDFAEAGKTTTRPAEKELSETAGDIRLAYSASDSAQSFVQALEERGIHLAAVTGAEAKRSQADHAAAKQQGREVPVYREGEFVAIGSLGQVYGLDRHTTGEAGTGAQKFLATLDRRQFQGIEATQEELALRAEQFISVNEAGDAAQSLGQHLASKALNPLSGLAGKARETLADMFSAPSPPAPEKTQAGREAPEQEKIDWRRYMDDRDYRRQVEQRQERQQPKTERERDPGGLDR